MGMSALNSAEKARWERVLMRRPGLALPRLRALMQSRDAARSRAALLGVFFVLERWGRATELQNELHDALQQAQAQRVLADAAELSEALGRLHYQRGDYAQACNAWSQTLDWATDESRCACLARIGLAHLCFALGEWARGGRVLDQAELHYPQLGNDPYLRAKIALNRAVSLRATQGPQEALLTLDIALSAAREVGHRDYQAEATLHHARCARDSGDPALALQLAQEALALAQRCGYRWLQAQAALLLAEMHGGDAALAWVEQALALAEAIQSRSLQALAHGRLAELMSERGELGPSWHHTQQRLKLESMLNQPQLPAQLETLARFDTDPTGVDALLLSLASQAWTLDRPEDFIAAWQDLWPRLVEGLGLHDLQLWWDRQGDGNFEAVARVAPALQAVQLPGYLGALARTGEPLLSMSASAHPWAAELDAALGTAASRMDASLELGLRVDARLLALLWLSRAPGEPWSRADISRAGRLAALLERLLSLLVQSMQRRSQQEAGREKEATLDLGEVIHSALDGVASLADMARRIDVLLQAGPVDREALSALAAEMGATSALIGQKLQQGERMLTGRKG